MTLVGLIIGCLFAAAGALYYKAYRDARERRAAYVDYPACVSRELDDRPLRRAWDSLSDHGRAELAREPADKLRDDLSLIAWMTDLARPGVGAELVHVGTDRWDIGYG